jgi:hypothetical protein
LLGCYEAVFVALASLPANAGDVTRTEFHWGEYCPPTQRSCDMPDGTDGHVIIKFVDGSQGYVEVATQAGQVVATSELMSLP